MLQTLRIRNYALIESVDIEFEPGLNILTGETGAGKSILIGALSFAMGEKASIEAMRNPKEKTVVEAVFALGDNILAKSVFESIGIEIEDGEAIIRREMLPSLRSTCRANGSAISAPSLRRIAPYLIDIYGQNENQVLLDPKNHLAFLDGYAKNELLPVLGPLEGAYEEMREIERTVLDLKKKIAESEEEKRKANEAISEIEPLNLKVDEEESMEARKKLLSNSQKLHDYAYEATSLLYSSSNSISVQLSRALSAVERAEEFDPGVNSAKALIESAIIDVGEATLSLRECLSSLDSDPTAEVESITARLSLIKQLKLKYAENIESILLYAENCRESLKQADSLIDLLNEAEIKLQSAKALYIGFAEEASKIRKAAAIGLSNELTHTLAELAMDKASFTVLFSRLQTPTAIGEDDASFLFSANPGMEPKPLANIASGGELSRIMLAIKNVYTDSTDSGCLIFDEIDTGVSGRAAQLVAEKMARLARKRQILAITHLTQIASMADTHFLIEKFSTESQTTSSVTSLEYDSRAEEIARMSSGSKVTEASMRSAKEMLDMANEYKLKLELDNGEY